MLIFSTLEFYISFFIMTLHVNDLLINMIFFGFLLNELFGHLLPNIWTSKPRCLNVIFSGHWIFWHSFPIVRTKCLNVTKVLDFFLMFVIFKRLEFICFHCIVFGFNLKGIIDLSFLGISSISQIVINIITDFHSSITNQFCSTLQFCAISNV